MTANFIVGNFLLWCYCVPNSIFKTTWSSLETTCNANGTIMYISMQSSYKQNGQQINKCTVGQLISKPSLNAPFCLFGHCCRNVFCQHNGTSISVPCMPGMIDHSKVFAMIFIAIASCTCPMVSTNGTATEEECPQVKMIPN